MNRLWYWISFQWLLVSGQRKRRFLMETLLLVGVVYVYLYFALPLLLTVMVRIALAYLSSRFFVSLFRFFIVTVYRRRAKLQPGTYDNFIIGIDSVGGVVVFLATAATVFAQFGIPVTTFLTSLALVAVGFAILFKTYIQNFIDGLRLMFSRDFLIGDYIETKSGTKGVITDINFRATQIRAETGDRVHVPNITLMASEAANLSKDKRTIEVVFSVKIKDIESLTSLEDHIAEHLRDRFKRLRADEKLTFMIDKLDKESVEYTVEIAMEQYSFLREAKLKDAVYRAVVEYVKTNAKIDEKVINEE